MAPNSNAVVVKQTHVVTPANPTPTCVLPLSAIDSQPFVRFICEYILIYSPVSGLDQSAVSSTFKSALSEILTLYYPFSGRVRERSDGSGLEVVCLSEGQGAVFIEAVSDGYSAADFDKPPKSIAEWQSFCSYSAEDVVDGPPLLVLQLTWLKDGAAAVGVGLDHSICDGIGGAEFLNSFAELVAGRLGSAAEVNPPPVWERHLLNSQPHRRLTPPPLPEFLGVPDLSEWESRFRNEPLVPTTMTFDKAHFSSLKSLAESTRLCGEAKFTTFEVLTAHIWRSWATAMKFPPNQTLKLIFSINVRKIMKSNLPEGYYGNAFVLCVAQTTAGELVEEKLGHAADLVKRAKETIGDEHVRHVIETVSQSKASPDWIGVLIAAQWSRFGFEKVDFGMGRPVHMGPVCCNQHCVYMPVYNQADAVKTLIGVPPSAVDEYEALVNNVAT